MYIFIAVVIIVVIRIFCLLLLHKNSQEFIAKLETNDDLYEKAGFPSKDYFFNSFFYPRYTFLLFIFRNKSIVVEYTSKHSIIILCTQVLISLDVLMLASVIMCLALFN